jgi:glycosyltransferase involved in cell wall biosynthesis
VKIIHLLEPGHAIPWILDLVLEQQRLGHDCEIVVMSVDSGMESAAAKNAVRFKALLNNRTSFLKWALNLRRNKLNDTILIAHGFKPSLFCNFFVFSKVKTWVWHHHQPFYFELSQHINRSKKFLLIFLNKWSLIASNKIISNSLQTSQYLDFLGVPKSKIVQVPLGIRLAKESEKIPPFIDHLVDKPFILMVGRLSWEKRYDLALDIFGRLSKDNKELHLLIAGDGPLLETLKLHASNLGISANVHFLGHVHYVPRLMELCRLFLHTAVTESYGQVIMEAVMAQAKVVTATVGIAHELKYAGIPNFWLFQSHDSREIAELLTHVLNLKVTSITDEMSNSGIIERHLQKTAFSELNRKLTP